MTKLLLIAGFFTLAVAYHEIHVRKEFSDAWEEMCEPYKNECIRETGVKEELVTKVFERGIYTDDYTFKCYIHCLHKRLHFLDKDGGYVKHNIYKKVKGINIELTEDGLYKVGDQKDACEKAYSLLIYLIKRISKKFSQEVTK